MADDVTFNLADLFELVADTAPQRLAYGGSDGTRLTYGELDERATKCANALTDFGVRRGDRIAVVARNRTEWIELLLAAFKVGALVANVNYRYTPSEVEYLFSDCEPVLVVSEAEFAGPAVAAARALPGIPPVLTIADASGEAVEGTNSYGEVVEAADVSRRFGPRAGGDGYLLYTGGTTGMPKGVLWTHENLFFGALSGGVNSDQLIRHPLDLADRVAAPPIPGLAVAPLMHGNAQWAVLRSWAAAGTAVLWTGPTFDPTRIWQSVEDFSVAVMSVVGDAMALPLLETLRSSPDRWELDSLMAFGSGGGVLSPHVKAGLRELLPLAQVVDGYGGSESGTIGVLTSPNDQKPPIFEVRPGTTVLREDLSETDDGEVGLLAASGAIATEYWRDSTKTAEVFRTDAHGKRWAVIGDHAIRNPDGTVALLGRGSLVVNTGGEKVFPDEVETVLKAHPDIMDSVVVGAEDRVFGEHVATVVQVRPNASITLDEIQRHARNFLAGYKVPRTFAIAETIPRSPAGKADYQWARQVIAETEQGEVRAPE